MKHLLCILIVIGVLATSIPMNKFQQLNKEEFARAMNSLQSFFNAISKCENSEWIDVFEDGKNVTFVIKCMDAKKTGL